MTLNEFIEYLTKLKFDKDYGDYEVRIGYRNGGGYCYGNDSITEGDIIIYDSNKIIEL